MALGLADSRQGALLHYCNKKPGVQDPGLVSCLTFLCRGSVEKTVPFAWTFINHGAKVGKVSSTCKFFGRFFKYFK